jgi:hypothetical protein
MHLSSLTALAERTVVPGSPQVQRIIRVVSGICALVMVFVILMQRKRRSEAGESAKHES